MPKYQYKAFDPDGKIKKGIMEEDDLDFAKDILMSKGYQVIHILKRSTLSDWMPKMKLSDEMLAGYCGEIATILDSGVSIIRGLEILFEQAQNKAYKAVVEDLLSNVKKGMNLSTAMERAEVFPVLLTDMVQSGEISSHLVDILFSMEDFYTREANIRKKIQSASVYPIILLAVSFGMVLFFNFYVFPEMKAIFEGVGELPALTQALIHMMDFMNEQPLVLAGGIFGTVLLVATILRLELVKYAFDRASLGLPLLGKVRRNIITARIASSMAIFIRSAVPLTKVLDVVESIAANRYISGLISGAKEEIVRGQPISDAFEETEAFDSMMVQMIRIGEETGKLEDMLFKVADIYEKRSNEGIDQLVAMVEPMFTLIIGLVVGLVIVAMAMPIFDMSNLIQ